MRISTSTIPAAAALVAALTALAATPAGALESDTFAVDSPDTASEGASVVSVRTANDDPADGVCTGTAVAPHWVVTARHCMDHLPTAGGSVRTGEGNAQRTVAVDRWLTAPQGDIALLHTADDLGLDRYATVDTEVPGPDTAARVYGWSSDGSGATTRLPVTDATVEGASPMALFDAHQALTIALAQGAGIQGGDSGGPVFRDGKLTGVLSAGLFVNPDDPEEIAMDTNAAASAAPLSDAAEWINDQIADDLRDTDAAADPGAGEANATPYLIAIAVLLAVAAGAAVVARRRGHGGVDKQ